MPNIQERLDQAVTVAETASQKLHQTVNGGETETVTVESGEIPTVAKAIKDIRDTILSNTNNLVEQAQNAAQEAVSAVDEAKQTLADTKNYVDSAKEEISTASTSAVENIQNQVSSAETRIDNKINQAEQSLDTTISSAVDEVKEAALSAAQSAIDNVTEDVTQAASAKIDTYVQTNIQPQIDNYVETNSYPAIDNYIETTTKPNIDEHTAALQQQITQNKNDILSIQTLKADKAPEINELSGPTLNLEIEKIYKISVPQDFSGALEFVLPSVSDNTKFHQIMGKMQNLKENLTVDWGTQTFFNGNVPEIGVGVYSVYFDYNPHTLLWVCGVMSEEDSANTF